MCVLLRRVLPVCTQAAAAERRLAHAQRVQLAATSPHQASTGFVESFKADWYQCSACKESNMGARSITPVVPRVLG